MRVAAKFKASMRSLEGHLESSLESNLEDFLNPAFLRKLKPSNHGAWRHLLTVTTHDWPSSKRRRENRPHSV